LELAEFLVENRAFGVNFACGKPGFGINRSVSEQHFQQKDHIPMRQMKKMLKWSGALAVALTLGVSGQANAAFQTAVAGYTQGNIGGAAYPQSLGFDFKANSNIVVNELGVYQVAPGAVSQGQVVYLYDVTTSTVIASAAETGTFQNGFNYVGIANTTLNTTDTYAIYSVFGANTSQFGIATAGSLTFSSDLTIQTIQGSNTGFTPNPTGTPPTPPQDGFNNILAVDFQYGPATTPIVPEPSSIALMGLGIVGVALVRHRMTRRSA